MAVKPRDVVAVGESIPESRHTEASRSILRGSRAPTAINSPECFVQACDLTELLNATLPPGPPPLTVAEVETKLAAARSETH